MCLARDVEQTALLGRDPQVAAARVEYNIEGLGRVADGDGSWGP